MTIEELSVEATDKENFSHDGKVVVWNPETCTEHEVRTVGYNEATKSLVITLEP